MVPILAVCNIALVSGATDDADNSDNDDEGGESQNNLFIGLSVHQMIGVLILAAVFVALIGFAFRSYCCTFNRHSKVGIDPESLAVAEGGATPYPYEPTVMDGAKQAKLFNNHEFTEEKKNENSVMLKTKSRN